MHYLVKDQVSVKLFGVFLQGTLVFSLFIYSLMSDWTHLFYSLSYNPILLYFVAQSILVLAFDTPLAPCPFAITSPFRFS